MSYHIYTTDGIILKRTPFGEANVLVHIATRDLGIIMASAQGVRQSSSKLNTGLQEFSLSTISCIKGKRGWKVTDARPKENFFQIDTAEARLVMARVFLLLLNVVTGEEPHVEIFETLQTGCQFLSTITAERMKDFECLIVLRILFYLGYVARNTHTEQFLNHTNDWSDTLLSEVAQFRPECISIINNGLKESHLTP